MRGTQGGTGLWRKEASITISQCARGFTGPINLAPGRVMAQCLSPTDGFKTYVNLKDQGQPGHF